jgi:hypothetical protein
MQILSKKFKRKNKIDDYEKCFSARDDIQNLAPQRDILEYEDEFEKLSFCERHDLGCFMLNMAGDRN